MKIIDKLKKKTILRKGNVYGDFVYANPNINIVSETCSICYNKDMSDLNDIKRSEYIRRRIATGHESILEHSNVITNYIIPLECLSDLCEVLIQCKYLNCSYTQDDEIHLTIAGSIRGYKHIVRNIKNYDNKVYRAILENLYQLHSCYFEDFINDNIMTRSKFIDIIDEKSLDFSKSENVNIINVDDIKMIMNKCNCTFNDALDLGTVTVLFKGISRTASHQLVRHRNAITQLSQRYTDSSDLKFINPADFKPDKYDKEKLYSINDKQYTLDKLGQSLITDIYPSLIEQGLYKEDARSFLPSNVETSLYMTFTFRSLMKFLELRTHTAAQAEIRKYALDLYNKIKEINPELVNYDYLEPYYKKIEKYLEETIDIDEVIE